MGRNIDFYHLIFACLNGTETEGQQKELIKILQEDIEARKCYVDYIITYTLFHRRSSSAIFGEEDEQQEICAPCQEFTEDSNVSLRGVDLSGLDFDTDTDDSKNCRLTQEILELLESERTSPAVEIPKEEPKRELIQKVERDFKWFPGRPSKFKLRVLGAMAACIMVTIGYLYFFAPKYVDHPVVAKLSDSLNAVWDNEFELPDEFGYMIQSRYGLKEGYASIKFNDGALVTVEAPADISLNSSGDMELFKGKIYAIVPDRAKGFSVKAAKSKIVDLGTEFGIEVDNSGNMQLHVTKGRTVLFADLFNGKSPSVDVDEGVAKKVYNDGFVNDIPVEKQKFARKINSKYNLVFKGQKFNSADVVGQLGILDTNWINPATGNPWAAGDQYRLVFVTSGTTQATPTDIGYYNRFVQAAADAAGLGSVTWNCICSTATVDARDNTGTNKDNPDHISVPVYLIDGSTILASSNAELWDKYIDNPVNIDENGNTDPDSFVFTGTGLTGQADGKPLGDTVAPLEAWIGKVEWTDGRHWIRISQRAVTNSYPIYGMSEPLTVVSKSAAADSVHTTR